MYSSTNYEWQQGFNATTGYNLVQDHNGYIWISTENGLMRFNGYGFKTYTTRDGLPDNEIITLHEDTEGRLWLLPFARNIAYIKNGKIYTPQNDFLLSRLKLRRKLEWLSVNKNGDIWIADDQLWLCNYKDSSVKKIDRINGKPFDATAITGRCLDDKGRLMIVVDANIYRWSDTAFIRICSMPAGTTGYTYLADSVLYNPQQGRIFYLNQKTTGQKLSAITRTPVIRHVHSVTRISGHEMMVTSDNGARILDIRTGLLKDTFLMGSKVGSGLKARDGSFWFGTTGKGISRFLSTYVKRLELGPAAPSIVSIKGREAGMSCTTDDALYITATYQKKTARYAITKMALAHENRRAHFFYVGQNNKGDWITCSDSTILRRRLGARSLKRLQGHVKSVLEEPSGHLIIGSIDGVFRLNKDKFLYTDTFLFRQRITTLARINDTIYAGTFNGVLACYPNKPYQHITLPGNQGDGHITALSPGKDGLLWVANGKTDLMVLKAQQWVQTIGIQDGLQCNRISCLKSSGNLLWVGTDNGLFAIAQTPPYKIVRHLTYATGLNSNQINCIDIYKGRVWVGTINGVNYFDESDIFRTSDSPKIIVNNIENDGKDLYPGKDKITLSNSPLTIDFDVVDFSGGTKPIFEYKIGENSEWIAIQDNRLYFPAIPYGNFTVFIRAFSPNWGAIPLFMQAFQNPVPLFLKWWFILIMIFCCFALLLITGFFTLRRIRSNDKIKLATQQNLLLLEQMALQGQMSPHFIFNSIAAIKQHYVTGNTQQANGLVDSFSALIRQTFEMAAEVFVSLDKELNYLRHYMDVEKIRFNASFQYSIRVDVQMSSQHIPVPAMLLQPVVENAIRHGVRHLLDKEGQVELYVHQAGERIIFTVTDNGIGRLKSLAMKDRDMLQPINSSSVNERRIHILNRLFNNKIEVRTDDLIDENGLPSGTRIVIAYPISIIHEISKNENSHYRR
ncbi:sensor histidine kinase [Taibaiella chishuiensis]|uniref:sensor histidine kinase n=1 Tax=Taibaiella chishuiensis TaxID=1434707 RepID=UPI0015E73194|nr:histidine kinase [Taibaiella chishuiensis]